MKQKILFAILITILISSCNKTEDVTIPGNIPPPDHTIDSSVMNLYVNKAFINLIGREPIGTEKNDGLAILRQHNFSGDDRKQFITSLTTKIEYNRNLYTVANNEYLRNLDSAEIAFQIYQFNYLLGQPQYAPFYTYLHYEIYRLDTLQMVMPMMNAGTMDYRGMVSRMTNNYFYDQINMGSENFVVSTYQNFLFRYPSDAELLNAKTMVDGNTATVFFQLGRSKYDYINIFFSTDDYYEGQVRFIFKKYLFREPSSAEIFFYALIYKHGTYQDLQTEIFATDEYAGI